MIETLDRAIRQLIITELEQGRGDIEVDFQAPTTEWSSRYVSRPMLNFYLFDMRDSRGFPKKQENFGYKKISYESINDRNSQHTPKYLDLTYLVTAWSGADDRSRPFDEHRLLWRTLKALMQHSTLNEYDALSNGEMFQNELESYKFPIYTSVDQSDNDGVMPNDFWSSMEMHPRPYIIYTVSVVANYESFEIVVEDEANLSIELTPLTSSIDLKAFEEYIKLQRRLYNFILVATGELGAIKAEDVPSIIEDDRLIPDELRLQLAWIESGSIWMKLKSASYEALYNLADFLEEGTSPDEGQAIEEKEPSAENSSKFSIRETSKDAAHFDKLISLTDDSETVDILKRYKNELLLLRADQKMHTAVQSISNPNRQLGLR